MCNHCYNLQQINTTNRAKIALKVCWSFRCSQHLAAMLEAEGVANGDGLGNLLWGWDRDWHLALNGHRDGLVHWGRHRHLQHKARQTQLQHHHRHHTAHWRLQHELVKLLAACVLCSVSAGLLSKSAGQGQEL